MENGKVTTLDGEAVDISEFITDITVRRSGTREDYFLRKFGSLHNAYLAFQKVSAAQGHTITIETFCEMLQWDLDHRED